MSKLRSELHSGWVLANHILVSFHVAFISSLLSIPKDLFGTKVLGFVFTSHETIISAAFWLICFHTGIAIHELGHYLSAVRLNALNESLLPEARKKLGQPFLSRLGFLVKAFLLIPYGGFPGVKKEGLTYYPDAPFNLAVAAAGPMISRSMAVIFLPVAIVVLALSLTFSIHFATYIGRLCLGLGLVGLLDFLFADPGKYREFIERERAAEEKAARISTRGMKWLEESKRIMRMMIEKRMQEVKLNGERLKAPWQFRNCGMGGRHTEKEYPESNISMQEMMFIPLCAKDYEEAQMITVGLQNRLKEIIESSEGARVMGIGLEGGLAPYIAKEPGDIVPEQRMWRMAVQAIKDLGYQPGRDIVIAFDPAVSELTHAYRKEFNQPDAVGMYYFWRSEEKVVMSREELLDLYKRAIEEIPIVSFEDAFAEDDFEGWKLLMDEMGDKVFVIGDDLVTTKDSMIEETADRGLINTALIKANQIGTLSETILALLITIGKNLEVVVSHRSKSPNDDMEAQIALALNAVGMKCGGGANTERLFKYGAVIKIMKDMEKIAGKKLAEGFPAPVKSIEKELIITDIIAYEEATNAGIPTVGVEVYVGIRDDLRFRKLFKFTGSTPLGTSAGTGEAIHLVDSTIEHSPLIDRYGDLFQPQPDKTYRFKKGIGEADITARNDPDLTALWNRANRYQGKGCLNAVDNVLKIIRPAFIGRSVKEFGDIFAIDRLLLQLELKTAKERGKLKGDEGEEELIEVMQRKGNLGMNAILSVSLAVARMAAHLRGEDLWMLLRRSLKEMMAKTIGDEAKKELPLEELKEVFYQYAQKLTGEGKKLYQRLREVSGLYR
ncbi:hypothetical protein DRP53_09205 [candidate division WOR-3 bacterium]|mgnify:CR=1 FL=1|uniref:Enolase n=1 Tax=candidate division WOR-3 bacterium TaxID=2052148 RepID=A0A660SG21_UNCW3|nr:MAG: hypothetical protein DRP53_09205 [candidate division WOR-3 bacterium]